MRLRGRDDQRQGDGVDPSDSDAAGAAVERATTETYRDLVSRPGRAMVVYEFADQTYGNCVLIRRCIRGVARQYPREQLRVVLVDLSSCRIGPDKVDGVPTLRLLLDGREVDRPRDWLRGESLYGVVMGWVGIPLRRVEPVRFHSAELGYGFRLDAWDKYGELGIRHVSTFLRSALDWFENAKALPAAVVLRPPFYDMARERTRNIGTFALSWPRGEVTEADAIEALDRACVGAASVQKMLGELPEWRRVAMKESGYLRDAIDALGRPSGELPVCSIMVRHQLGTRPGAAGPDAEPFR